MTEPLGPKGRFYRDAMARVAVDFPERNPAWDSDYAALVDVVQAGMQAAHDAYEVRQQLDRAEMANLSLSQAASLVEYHYKDGCASWPAGPRALNLITSAMQELTLAEANSPNPDELDDGPAPAMTLLAEARGHLELAESRAGSAAPGVALSKDLVELALQDLERLTLRLRQLNGG